MSEETKTENTQGNGDLGGVVKRSLASINMSDIASLDSLVRHSGWRLINDGNGTIKINMNPNSEFERRVCYVINKYDRKSLCRECPYQIYLYLRDEGFDV